MSLIALHMIRTRRRVRVKRSRVTAQVGEVTEVKGGRIASRFSSRSRSPMMEARLGCRTGTDGCSSASKTYSLLHPHWWTKMSRVIHTLRLLAAVLLSVLLLPSADAMLHSQQAPTRPTRVPVTLAMVDGTLTGGESYRILRRADQSPHDLLLLRSDADVAVLSGAIENLLLIRAQTGDTARVSGTTRIRRSVGGPERPSRVLPWAGRVLNDLRRAQPRPVAGVGTVPTVEVWLPPQAGRRR